jgi:ParB-like nuclease domain
MAAVPALKVEQWPIDRLVEYARNPRKNDAHVDRMAGAIREFGFRIPICARSDGTVVDGHLRLKAARKLGLTEAPTPQSTIGIGGAESLVFVGPAPGTGAGAFPHPGGMGPKGACAVSSPTQPLARARESIPLA